jgi:hypothetical protein
MEGGKGGKATRREGRKKGRRDGRKRVRYVAAEESCSLDIRRRKNKIV